MRLTIVPIDKRVGVDGVFIDNIDLSSCAIPDNIHALQWYDTEGEVEFSGRPKPHNEFISELPAWANTCATKWSETKAALEAAVEAAKQADPNYPKTTNN